MNESWQHPYVDIFKSFNVWDFQKTKKVGDVTIELVLLIITYKGQ